MKLLTRSLVLVAVVASLSIGLVSAFAECPAPARPPQAGDRCIAAFVVPNWQRDKVDPVPVYVVRFKALDSSDLASWTVPGAVVVPLDGTQRGQQVAVPLSILSDCRP